MHFFRDCSVGSVLTKSLGAFLGSFAARRAKTRDGFCPILMYYTYTAVLGFGFLRHSISCIFAVVRARFLTLMYKDVQYAGFAGAKTGHKKITIFRGAY